MNPAPQHPARSHGASSRQDMTEDIKRQLRENGVNIAPEPRTAPPTPREKQSAREGRSTPKEAPGPKPNTPLRYATAGPLHAEQHPGEFRCTVTGPLPMLPAVVKALEELVQLAKNQITADLPPVHQANQ